MKLEQGDGDPDTITNINAFFEPSVDANLIHRFLQGFGRKVREYGVKAVIEKMCRVTGRKLYVRIGFRAVDAEEDEEECTGK